MAAATAACGLAAAATCRNSAAARATASGGRRVRPRAAVRAAAGGPAGGEDSLENRPEDDVFFRSAAQVQEWLATKPRGFAAEEPPGGTPLEDRLMEEIESGRKAAAAGKRAPHKGPSAPAPPKKAEPKLPPEGVEVWVGGLPKKRNVERDLAVSLKGTRGLLHIRPAVSGTEKTREPVCKGFGFLTFVDLPSAERFVENCNGLVVRYGKVEKALVCQVAKTPTSEVYDLRIASPASPNSSKNGPKALPKLLGSVGISLEKGPPPASKRTTNQNNLEKKAMKTDQEISFREDKISFERLVDIKRGKVADGSIEAMNEVGAGNVAGLKTAAEAGEEDADDVEIDKSLGDEIWDALEDEDDLELDLEEDSASITENRVEDFAEEDKDNLGEEYDDEDDEDDDEGWDDELEIETSVTAVTRDEHLTKSNTAKHRTESVEGVETNASVAEEVEVLRRRLALLERSLQAESQKLGRLGKLGLPGPEEETPAQGSLVPQSQSNLHLEAPSARSTSGREPVDNGHAQSDAEARIEALERRLLAKASAGGFQDATEKKTPGGKAPHARSRRAKQPAAQRTPGGSQPVAGQSIRIGLKKEKQLLDEVLLKYNSSTTGRQ